MTATNHTEHITVCRDRLAAIGADQARIAIILGSGLGGLDRHLTDAKRLSYGELVGFPKPGVAGHAGEAVVGKLNGVPVLLYRGRQHFYETHDASALKVMIRTVKALGIPRLFISNAAGALNTSFGVGELMAITDHINMMGFNPLIGENDDDWGPRFPAMSGAWNSELTALLHEAAAATGVKLNEGVYLAFRGPTFETAAEIKMAQGMGGDAVGMSSVPDCIIARHCGLEVVGCSCLTNMGEGLSDEKLSHSHTLENAARAAEGFEKLISHFVTLLPKARA